MSSAFPLLFRPGRIGSLEVRNRLLMPPMATGFCEPDGRYSQRQIDWYAARARGGAGLVEAEACAVESDITGLPSFPANALDSALKIPRAHELTTAMHDFDALVSVQLSVGQGRCRDWGSPDDPPVSASPVPWFVDPDLLCRPLTIGEIHQLVDAFADAAERAVRAGFDMISVHNHGGYLLDQFMSPLWNRRDDEYGGDLDGRMRFPLEIIAEARRRIGPDVPIGFRVGLDLKVEGACTRDEGLEICRRLEAAGVDVLSIDQGCTDTTPYVVPPRYLPTGLWLDDAAAVKEVVSIPVVTSANTFRPEVAEQMLRDGIADFVLMGRPLIADPELPNKARDGRVEEIRPCTRCNEKCISGLFALVGVGCQVNVAAGAERHYATTVVTRPKTVVVVGGGPGGLEAARVAGSRGHDVTLFEQDSELGGLLRAAGRSRFKGELAALLDYYEGSLARAGVTVRTGVALSADDVVAHEPDAVVVATGASPFMPDIPGIGGDHVVIAGDLVLHDRPTGASVVVAGGGMVGCEIALDLAQAGKQVTILEAAPLAADINPINGLTLVGMVAGAGVDVLPFTLAAVTSEGVVGVGPDGGEHVVQAETVVIALGGVARDSLARELEGRVDELYAVGDCARPRSITEAVHDGFVAGWRI